MSTPTVSDYLNQTTPAAPTAADQNHVYQSDNATPEQSITSYTKRATSTLFGTTTASGGVSVKTADYTLAAADCGTLVVLNSASAHTFTLPATPPSVLDGASVNRWRVSIENVGAGVLTLAVTSAATLDGSSASVTLATSTGLAIYTDGTNYFTERGVAPKATSTLFGTTTTSGGVSVKTADYTLAVADCGTLVVLNSASAHTFTLPATPPSVLDGASVNRWRVPIANVGAGVLTLAVTAAATLDGSSASVSLATSTGLVIYTDGTNYFTERGAAPAGITLKHDGTLNGSQTLLNLKSGTGIAITDDGSGGVTVAAQASAPGFVQATGNVRVFVTGISTTFSSNVALGDLLVVSYHSDSGAPTAISDNLGNVFTLVARSVDNTVSAWSVVVTVPGSCTISVTPTGSPVRQAIFAEEYSGITATLDGTPAYSTTVANPAVATVTTASANSLVWSFFNASANSGSPPPTPAAAGFTTRNFYNPGGSSPPDLSVSASVTAPLTGSQAASWTNTATSGVNVVVLAFRAGTNATTGVTNVSATVPSDFSVTVTNPTTTPAIAITGGVTKSGVQQEAYTYAADSGAANAYAVTLSPAPTLVAGSVVTFKAANANSGASTLAVNGGTATAIKKNGNSTALASGDIAAGQIVTAKYDGTVWQIVVGTSVSAGVASLNSLTGALSIVAGSNVTVTPSGSNISIAATGGGGGSSFPFTIVQDDTFNSGGSNVTSYVYTFPQAVAASGNTMWLVVACDGSSAVSISSAGWTIDINRQQSTYARLIVAHKTTASETSVTLAVASASSFAGMFFEMVGAHSIDQQSTGGTANTTSLATPAITPTSGSLMFSVAAFVAGSPTSGFVVAPVVGPSVWSSVAVGSAATGGRALGGLIYQLQGAGVSITPPRLRTTLSLFATGGVAYATFSIL